MLIIYYSKYIATSSFTFHRITTSKLEEPQGTIKPSIDTSHNHVPQERVGFISV